eukprot:scaffold996_cov409-Prasinococcus_capsulatus_cf.AAC.20
MSHGDMCGAGKCQRVRITLTRRMSSRRERTWLQPLGRYGAGTCRRNTRGRYPLTPMPSGRSSLSCGCAAAAPCTRSWSGARTLDRDDVLNSIRLSARVVRSSGRACSHPAVYEAEAHARSIGLGWCQLQSQSCRVTGQR